MALCVVSDPRGNVGCETYSGVFEAVAIRKKGYPFRLSHNAFEERYKKICGKALTGKLMTGNFVSMCRSFILP